MTAVVGRDWTSSFTINDALALEALDDDTRAIVERYAEERVRHVADSIDEMLCGMGTGLGESIEAIVRWHRPR